MDWNWQQADWPHFTWSASRLAKAEEQFLLHSGMVMAHFEHLGDKERERLTVEALSAEALTTSAIEGEMLDRDSVQSSVRRELGLATQGPVGSPAERGIAEMMVRLFRSHAQALCAETIHEWHRLICQGRQDLHHVGAYRRHEAAMQLVSGRLDKPRVHFEAPPSARVPQEMEQFLIWLATTAPQGECPLPALTRSGIAHLWFVTIHPYEDGNGRLARAIAEKILMESLGCPSMTALAATIMHHRGAYYEALEASNRSLNLTDWLAWSAATTLEAQHRAMQQVGFLLDKARLFERLRGQLNQRQETALLRMFREGMAGFRGGLSAGNYISLTRTSPATATRDLADLVAKGALCARGEHRARRYDLAIPARPVPRIVIDPEGNLLS